jgi:hypothetical protein
MTKRIIKGAAVAALAVCMVSCTQPKSQRQNIASLVEAEPCMVPLDSVTTQITRYMQLYDDSTLTFYNQGNHDICVVNLNTMSTCKIPLSKQGPNGIPWLDSYCYSPDSTWAFVAMTREIIAIDQQGNVLAKMTIPREQSNGAPFEYAVIPYPRTVAPYLILDSKHVLAGYDGYSSEEQPFGTVLIYDENANECMTGNPYPEVYGKVDGKWGVFDYRAISYTPIFENKLLINFPASDSLYLYDPKTQLREPIYAAWSSETNIHKNPYSGSDAWARNYLEQYAYIAVLYDKYNKVYYRMLRLPVEDYDTDTDFKEAIKYKPIAVIVLDEDFSIIGETVLPEGSYLPGHCFVTPAGLFVNAESDDDDFMKFRVFKLKIDR